MRPHPTVYTDLAIKTRPIAVLLVVALLALTVVPAAAAPIFPDVDTEPGAPPAGLPEGRIYTPTEGKNTTRPPASDPAGAAESGEPVAIDAADGLQLIACGEALDGDWTTTSNSFQIIRSCELSIPHDGLVYINATTALGLTSGGQGYEARLALGIDTLDGVAATDRWINVYADSTEGSYRSGATTLLAPVTAGVHTFYFFGARFSGPGTVQLSDPSLSVLYIPGSSTDVLACGGHSNAIWNTSHTYFEEIRQCSLTARQGGYAYLVGTSSVRLSTGDGAVEGVFGLGVDSVGAVAGTQRWVNVYPDDGDGTDENVATSLLTPIAAGQHTFYFSGRRYSGSGTDMVQLLDPSLVVLFFPAPNIAARTCGAADSGRWTSDSDAFTTVRSCTVDVPSEGIAFVDADASAGLTAGGAENAWAGQFRIGADDAQGSSYYERRVDVYDDATDGSDRTLATSALFSLPAGPHTFYMVGRRTSGSGSALLENPALTVIVPIPGARVFMPIVLMQ